MSLSSLQYIFKPHFMNIDKNCVTNFFNMNSFQKISIRRPKLQLCSHHMLGKTSIYFDKFGKDCLQEEVK